jgi:hypothetical protein
MIKFQGIGAQGNYSQAGKAVADDTLRAFLAARRNSPNMGEIALTNAELKKKEKLATIKNQAEVAATRLTADADVKAKKMQIDSASKLKSAKRKAGALAVAGQMATEAGALFGEEKRKKRELGGDDTYYNNQTALINKRRAEIETRMKEGYGTKSEPSTESSTSTTSLPVSTQKGSALTGNSKILADKIAGPESGDWGYDAFNQGGAKGGREILGKYGSHKEKFGKSLTSMTLGEVLQRQSGYDDYSITDQQWRDNDGLHAVGRYQFIGPTLKEEVTKMGLPMDTPFNEATQDAIFLSHAKRIGNISPWIGPSDQYDASETAYLNSLIRQL